MSNVIVQVQNKIEHSKNICLTISEQNVHQTYFFNWIERLISLWLRPVTSAPWVFRLLVSGIPNIS